MATRQRTEWTWIITLFWLLGHSFSRAQAVSSSTSAVKVPSVLYSAAQVRALDQREASSSIPIQLQGRVMALSGLKNFFFLQDHTAAIAVDRTDSTLVHMGDLVSVTGTSRAGSFAPVVLASAVRVEGRLAVTPADPMEYDKLVGGTEDSQWIQVEGIVRSAAPSKLWAQDTIALNVEMSGGPIVVHLQDYSGLDLQRLVDAKIRVRGICATNFNDQRQFVGLLLLVPARGDLLVVQPAPRDAFSVPSVPLHDVMQFNPAWRPGHRIKVQGIVTYQNPGHGLFLQEGEDAIELETPVLLPVKLGSLVEAVGFPAIGNYAPKLEDSTIRVKSLGPSAKAEQIKLTQVFSQHLGFQQAPFDEHLVQVDADLVETHSQQNGSVWILREGGTTFTAQLPASELSMKGGQPRLGSRLQMTGICSVHTDTSRTPVSFELLLRSPEDIRVLREAPWWTPKHALAVSGILAAGITTIALWVIFLKRRVRAQTLLLRASEQRFREMAERDVLTGLPNRLFLEERITRCLAVSEKEHLKAAVLTIDIDHFKQVNDRYGHLVGDECLKEVAGRLKTKVRGIDTIARTGGEEFTLIVGRLGNQEDAMKICSALLGLFESPVRLPQVELTLSVSIGVAMYPDDGPTYDKLRMLSDEALYHAKRTGRNRAAFADCMLTEHSGIEPQVESQIPASNELLTIGTTK